MISRGDLDETIRIIVAESDGLPQTAESALEQLRSRNIDPEAVVGCIGELGAYALELHGVGEVTVSELHAMICMVAHHAFLIGYETGRLTER